MKEPSLIAPANQAGVEPSALSGILLTVASAACISVTFVASKQAMQELTPLGFTPLWFAVASAWGGGFYLLRNGLTLPAGLRPLVWPLLLLGVLNGLANLLLFTAINLGDPTVAAFFSRSETVYAVLLGTLLLGERMLAHQWAGVGLAVIGAGVMTFRGGTVVGLMLALLLVSNFLLSLSTLVAKKHIHAIPPLLLSTIRTGVMMVMLGCFSLLAGQLAWPGLTTWLWIIGGAFFGPFLSYLLFYQGLVYLDMGKSVVIRSTQPLFVAVYGWLLFGTLITAQQFIGGMIMLAGVVLMLWRRAPGRLRRSPV